MRRRVGRIVEGEKGRTDSVREKWWDEYGYEEKSRLYWVKRNRPEWIGLRGE